MEPETKKVKYNSTSFHDAIDNIRAFDSNALFILFCKEKNVARIKDANDNYPLFLLFRSRWDVWHDDPILVNLIVELLHHYPDAICQKGWINYSTNPLHVVAKADSHQLLLVILNKNRSLINMLDENSRTPLQIACDHKSRNVVETILKFHDVMVNNVDELGYTALLSVALSGAWKIVSLLLQYPGIDVLAGDGRHSAFQLFLTFVNRNRYKDTRRSHIFRVVKVFMNSPGVLTLKNKLGENIVHDIVSWNNPHLLAALFSCNNNNLMDADLQGKTALHKACNRVGSARSKDNDESPNNSRTPYIQCLNMILSKVDVLTINKKDQNGETALHYACHWENHVAIKELLKIPGIDSNIFNDKGNTPLLNTIILSEEIYEKPDTKIRYEHLRRDMYGYNTWDSKSIRLLLNYNECLVLARNKSGNRLLDLARNRLEKLIGNREIPLIIRYMKQIIGELEDYTTKARWKMFQYIHKRSLVNK